MRLSHCRGDLFKTWRQEWIRKREIGETEGDTERKRRPCNEGEYLA